MVNFAGKYKSMPKQAKASLWYTVCNILQKGISLIVVPIYTRLLTTSEYGQYSVFQSWQGILIIFATLNLYCGVFTKAMVDYDDDRDRYISCMQGLSSTITAALFAVYVLAHHFWNSVFEMDTVTMSMMFVYFIFYPAFSFWSVRQRVELKYTKMVLVTLGVSVATPALSLYLLFCTDLRVKAVIWGYMLVQIAVGFYFYIFQFIKGKKFFIKKYWVHGLKFNIPLIPHYLSLIVLGQADRIMIRDICGDDKAGIYNLAYQVSMVMNVFVGAINNSLVPWIYEKLKKKEYQSIRTVTKKLCILVGAMTAGVILVAPEAIRILGTKEYLTAIWIIPAVAMSVYLTFCYGLFSNVEFYFGATRFVMVASTVGAVLNVVLNAIFIPLYGFIAAGYTTLVCYLTFMVMHFLFMQKICKKENVAEPVYDIRFIFVSCLIMGGFAAIGMFLYKGFILRYAIIVFAFLLAWLKRKKIMDIVSSVRS